MESFFTSTPLGIITLVLLYTGIQTLFLWLFLFITFKILKITEFKLRSILIAALIYNIMAIIIVGIIAAGDINSIGVTIFRILLIYYYIQKQVKPAKVALKALGLIVVMMIVFGVLLGLLLGTVFTFAS